jgi:hypothetical protein
MVKPQLIIKELRGLIVKCIESVKLVVDTIHDNQSTEKTDNQRSANQRQVSIILANLVISN